MKIVSRALPILFLALAACGGVSKQPPHEIEHLPSDFSGAEYRDFMAKHDIVPSTSPDIQNSIHLGERSLTWLDYMNSFRQPADRLRLTNPAGAVGYPIETPNLYGPSTIAAELNRLRSSLPASLSTVLFDESAALTKNPPLADADYVVLARQVDRLYQTAVRWTLFEPYLSSMANRRHGDIRGYYFLEREPGLDAKLNGWATLAQADKTRLTPYLLNTCLNVRTKTESVCQNEFSAAVAAKNVAAFRNAYRAVSKRQYELYFAVQNARPDMNWMTGGVSVLPFQRPDTDARARYIVDNVQDEWRWQNWSLHLDFASATSSSPYVTFVPGETPHVDGLGASHITMDANQSIEEYESQWTIRHEFGHVLGLPDCYVEFYDPQAQVMINYQIDVNDLMCSRRGKMNERIALDLQKAYGSR